MAVASAESALGATPKMNGSRLNPHAPPSVGESPKVALKVFIQFRVWPKERAKHEAINKAVNIFLDDYTRAPHDAACFRLCVLRIGARVVL